MWRRGSEGQLVCSAKTQAEMLTPVGILQLADADLGSVSCRL